MQFEVKIKINKKLYSREHLLADDISKMMFEPKNFAAYLGIAKLYHEDDLRALAKRVAARKGLPVEARGKYFFAALKNLNKLYRGESAIEKKKNVKNRNGKK